MSFLNGLANLINPGRFSSVGQVAPAEITPQLQTAGKINGNPFIGEHNNQSELYGKNRPVPGGYFAGYYNGKPNIVGQKLFIVI